MSDFLFDVPETLSPRLAWMREHSINVQDSTADDKDHDYDWKYIAYQHGGDPRTMAYDFGETEDEALDRLAAGLKIKPWRA